MRQLNNPDGKVIQIDAIKVYENTVIYNIFEFGDKNIKIASKAHTFATPLPKLEDASVNYYELACNQLISEKENDFIFSDDLQNWTIKKGSTGADTTARVYIPFVLIGKEISTGSAFDLLIKAMSPIAEFAQRNGIGAMQYLEKLGEQEKAILQLYESEGVKIEYKNA